ncbi:MAG TPA: chemotaxis protein CheB, partial [Candidatus Binatia bacterium]|nr:chemotaxis protein CheB [Candidatus Binatia bacterium]
MTVVGVGASAGGLDAFSQMLDAMDEAPNVAIVFIQHLSPQHKSALPTLLSARTQMPVIQVSQGTPIEANHVYVIPPNCQMEMRDGSLHLSPRPDDRTQYTPIDIFFRSLAETARNRAIGVILSGSSSDGASGFRDIKAVGGFTIAQDPQTARHDAMPRAAIATEAVDLVLSPRDIGNEITRLVGHTQMESEAERRDNGASVAPEHLRRLVTALRAASNIDFAHYKPPTIIRRLRRRMALQRSPDVEQYLRRLQEDADEARKLAQDILIHVTRFFRDPESFTALAEEVFPEILARGGGESRVDDPIRIWVPGCSTGEEAYSVAITLLECLGEKATGTPIQIFASDISETAIAVARAGVYPLTIAADVSPERLRRFFAKTDGGYRINKAVRDLCIFARQDLTRDAPFSRLDLIVCRNVLIYLGAAPQRKLLSVFDYALKSHGFLMLGHAESTGPHGELFVPVHNKQRIYRKRADGVRTIANLEVDFLPTRSRLARAKFARPETTLHHEVQRLLMDRYAPPGVIIDADMKILQFLGRTGRFLEPPPGDAVLTLPRMLKDRLLHGMRTVFDQARRSGRPARRTGLQVRSNGDDIDVTLEVIPIDRVGEQESHYLVLFQEVPKPERRAAEGKRKRAAGAERAVSPRVARIEQELAASREYLHSIIQELEAANEELQSANEEILSSNEELQSTNEELDTAKEELQSTNEELNTVNDELQTRNEELLRVNSDLVNLLNSVQIALVIIEGDLKIRRFTTMAERVLNLIPSDVGRPIGHLKPNIDCPDLEDVIRSVMETVVPQEREVRDLQGRWYSLLVRPYKS